MSLSITSPFCCLDDFARIYEDWERQRLIPTARRRRRPGKLVLSEMLFIMVLFHLSPFKDFKHFWIHGVEQKHCSCFRLLPSHGRVRRPDAAAVHPVLHPGAQPQGRTDRHLHCRQHPAGGLRHPAHQPEPRLPEPGPARTAAGWFHGFKLHVVINHNGEVMAVRITPGNTDDRSVLDAMTAGLQGRVLADKGYISQKLFAALWRRGLKLITGIRRNMRNHLMPLLDKLKSQMGLEHTRHRSPVNAFVHILSCLVAYALGKAKVKMKDVAYP